MQGISRMPISIKNPKTEMLARRVARLTGETLTEAIHEALEERCNLHYGRGSSPPLTVRRVV